MVYRRKTLAKEVRLEGHGLHTGEPVRLTIHPGESGIRFRYGGSSVLATPENVSDTTRSTRVGEVGTVEHLMSAFAGLEVTDAEVEVDAPELPGLDGSSIAYVQALAEAGFVEIDEREVPALFKRVFLQEEGIKIAASKGTGHWRYVYATGERWPVEQAYESSDVIRDYGEEIAPSRTFALSEEIPKLIELGLGRGLDENSALIVGIEGYKNEPRFPDEPARHKLLDLLGDLYLSGVPARALNVVAERSGHRTNVQAAAILAKAMSGEPAAQP
ncbi:MAG TPA: UDP-3-O-acyl-N-acetylglucosamine deacetylase [Fimbriimonas sp.]